MSRLKLGTTIGVNCILASPAPSLTFLSSLFLSAMTIYQSLNSSCFMFSVGFSVAASSLVGKTLGQNLPSASKYNARVSTIAACVVSALLGTTMYVSDHEILPGLFTKYVDVIRETARTLPLLSLYVFADGVQVTLSGVLKGCGMQVRER